MVDGRFDGDRVAWWVGRTTFFTLVIVLVLLVRAMGVGPEGSSTAARDLLGVGSAPVVAGALVLSLLIVWVWESLA